MEGWMDGLVVTDGEPRPQQLKRQPAPKTRKRKSLSLGATAALLILARVALNRVDQVARRLEAQFHRLVCQSRFRYKRDAIGRPHPGVEDILEPLPAVLLCDCGCL